VSPKAKALHLDAYVRVSRVGGRGGESFISPDVQREQIQRWADYTGATILRWHEDLDQTGGKMSRPAFDEMMERITSGATGGVVVAKTDRFARTLVGALGALEALSEAGAAFVSVADSFDTSTPSGKMALRMVLTFAEFERDRIKESWATAASKAMARGVHVSRGQYLGYDRDTAGRLIKNEQAPLAREVFLRRAQRTTWWALANYLDEVAPRPDGKRWTHQNVKRMVGSRVYAGKAFRSGMGEVDAQDPIVTLAEWEAANSVSGGRARTNGAGPQPLLAGIIRCAHCRYAMRLGYVTSKRKDGTVTKTATYQCSGKHTAGRCPSPAHIRADDIEHLAEYRYLTYHGESARALARPDLDRVAELEGQVEDLRERYDSWNDDDEMRQRDRPGWERGRERRLSKMRVVEGELVEARKELNAVKLRPITQLDEWDGLDVEDKHSRLKRAIDSIYVARGRESAHERTWFRWAGEDALERPERGKKAEAIIPVPWPENPVAASVPAFAVSPESAELGPLHYAPPKNVSEDLARLATRGLATLAAMEREARDLKNDISTLPADEAARRVYDLADWVEDLREEAAEHGWASTRTIPDLS
jgi:site-specific DNA recombinase